MNARKSRLLFAAIGLLMLASASEGAWYETAADIAAGHDWGKTSRFGPILHLTAYKPDGTAVSSGTATLISPEWVLTASAAHFGLADSLGSVRLLSCYDPVNVPATHTRWALEMKTHDDQPQVIGEGVDLMLLRIDPITDITPVSLFTGAPQIGMEFVGAGFGRPGSVETGMLSPDWKKRAGNNEVSAEAFGLGGYIQALFRQGPNALPLEWASTPGDSGGPWLTEANELFAVDSFAVNGVLSGGQPIYPHLPWIYSVTGLPEPGTLVLMAASMTFLLRRRTYKAA
ncbi:MAG: trypsin-like serine protease [Phycisphaerae bacterium]|nr:trypsin-like serine protease [Phycisphaerae bacterium]